MNKIFDTFKAILLLITAIAVFSVLIFGISYGSYEMYRYFSPKYANVQNEIYQNNAAYQEGMIRDMENLRLEYLNQKDVDKRVAIRSVILHRMSVYGVNKLPMDLQNFYKQLEGY